MTVYFLSYQAIDEFGDSIIGNAEYQLQKEINSFEDIQDAQKVLKKAFKFKSIVIINFIKLRDE